MKKLLVAALLLRLFLAPWAFHGDSYEFLNWGKNLQEFGMADFYFRDTPNAVHPNYPPVFYELLLANQWFYTSTRAVFWQINITIPPFPSQFIVWFNSDLGRIFFNKLPAIFADIAVGYLIYLFVSDLKSKRAGVISATAFLFSAPIWYNSAVWGSTESIFALPLIASFYAIYKRRLALAPVLFTLSFLVKPTVLLVLPAFAIWWFRQVNRHNFLKGTLSSLILFYLLHIPFHPQNTAAWIVKLYRDDIRETLGYVTANAFNIWSFFFGFSPVSDSSPVLGIPAVFIGYLIFGLFAIYFLTKITGKTRARAILFAAALLSFTGFLFLTRIHERYFYLTLLFLAPLVGLDRRLSSAFWLLSGIHLVNLYHFWWVPRVDFLVELLSIRLVEQVLILANIAVFIWLFKLFKAGRISS